MMRWLLSISVAVATSAFIPAEVATADAFEVPKLFAWCLALALASFAVLLKGFRTGTAGDGSSGDGLCPAWFAAALLAWMAARSIFAENLRDWTVFAGWTLPPAMYLAGRGQNGATARAVAWACAFAAVAQCLLMLGQRLGVDPLFGATTAAMDYVPERMVGTVGYHNQAVDLLAVCGTLAMPLFPAAFRVAVPMLLIVFAALASYRAGIAGAALGMAAAFVNRLGNRRSAAIAAAVCAAFLLVALAVPETRARFADVARQGFSTPALRTRATMARTAFAMIRERPLAGHGSGSYAYQYTERLAATRPAETTHEWLVSVEYAREPHNDLLHLWSEFGLIGVALALGWLALSAKRQRAAGRCLIGYWLVASLFGFPWHDSAAGPLFGLALGLLEGVESDGTALDVRHSREDSAAGRHPRVAATIACAGGLGLAGIAGMVACAIQIAADTGGTDPEEWQGRAMARQGGILAVEGMFAEAEWYLAQSLEKECSPELLSNIGFVKMKRGKPAEAEVFYRKMAASGINHFQALTSLAGALEAQGKFLEAGKALLERHRLWPERSSDADVFRMAALLLRGGAADKAIRIAGDFERRNGDTPCWTAEWENLYGAAYLSAGNAATAKRHFTRALELNPKLESARKNLLRFSKDGGASCEPR